jgi:hypothetical protein
MSVNHARKDKKKLKKSRSFTLIYIEEIDGMWEEKKKENEQLPTTQLSKGKMKHKIQ